VKLPEIELDDRRFQDLVSEARTRIANTSPGWTDHNVSDPGITLIELFAWMTEMTIYRLNRVPDKLHIALLELLGIPLDGPSAATTTLRFRLTATPEEPLTILGETEVGTERTATEEAIVFQTDEDFTIPPLRPVAYRMQRADERWPREVLVGSDGVASPLDLDRLPFGSPSTPGDAFYLGFEAPLDRLLLEVDVTSESARGAGVDPHDPIVRWEVSQPDDEWAPALVLEDETGGFNYGNGLVKLEMPARSAAVDLGGQTLHWLRCRVHDESASGQPGLRYERSPEIAEITARPIGARVPATHAARVAGELLGVSDGTPAQVFPLRYRPILKPDPKKGETLEVRAPLEADDAAGSTNGAAPRAWVRWEQRDDFASSKENDPHFSIDAAAGEITLGPVIRERPLPGEVEGWIQHGLVPPRGAELRFTRYRYGGGRAGNVRAHALRVLKTSLPGIDTVDNPDAAVGGVDAETLDEARDRAALEIRSRSRAVTADDLEFLASEASARVGRVVCLEPEHPGGAVRLHIAPRVPGAERLLSYGELMPDEAMIAEVTEYLEERRVLGMRVDVAPVVYRPVSVIAEVKILPLADSERVTQDVLHALNTFLNPLVGGNPYGPGEGWPFGRTIIQGELYGIVHAVQGVAGVPLLQIFEYDLKSGLTLNAPITELHLAENELAASGEHMVKIQSRQR
jgi:predicted phage baseplate assembly protein